MRADRQPFTLFICHVNTGCEFCSLQAANELESQLSSVFLEEDGQLVAFANMAASTISRACQ